MTSKYRIVGRHALALTESYASMPSSLWLRSARRASLPIRGSGSSGMMRGVLPAAARLAFEFLLCFPPLVRRVHEPEGPPGYRGSSVVPSPSRLNRSSGRAGSEASANSIGASERVQRPASQ